VSSSGAKWAFRSTNGGALSIRPTRIELAIFGLEWHMPPARGTGSRRDATEMRPTRPLAPYHRAHGDQKDGTRRDRVDLAAAIEFCGELELEPEGKGQVEGDRGGPRHRARRDQAELGMRTADGHRAIELVKFHSPPTQGGDPHAPSNTQFSALSP
jgi:hypothetical protein